MELPENSENIAQDTTVPRPKRRWGSLLAWIGAIVAAFACVGCAALAIVMDQTALAANVYLQAVGSNNKGLAMALGDHYTSNAEGQRAIYELDVDRDLEWLGGASISDIQATREETVSGQSVTILKFKWRPAGSGSAPQEAALRVKTDRWFLVTYIRTVEVIDP